MKVRDLKKVPLKRLIVIVNQDDFILEFSKELIVSRISPEEKVVLWGDEWKDENYTRLILSPDLLGRKKLVLVKRAEFIPKRSLSKLRSSEFVYQLFLSKEELEINLDRRTFLYAKISKPQFKEAVEIVRFLFKRAGIEVNDEEAVSIYDLLGRDLMEVWRESEKLSVLGRGKREGLKELLFPMEKGRFWDALETLSAGKKAEFVKKVKEAKTHGIPPLYFLAVLWSRAGKDMVGKLIEIEKKLKLGAGWEEFYRLILD